MEKPNRDRVLDHWYDQDVLTVDGIIVIHDEIIELYGGFSGVMKRGELEFVVDQVNYENKDVYWNTALILRNITSNHPFVDGNKRTALEVADVYLRLNNLEISASEEDKVNYMIHLASHEVELNNIIEWLKNNTSKTKI